MPSTSSATAPGKAAAPCIPIQPSYTHDNTHNTCTLPPHCIIAPTSHSRPLTPLALAPLPARRLGLYPSGAVAVAYTESGGTRYSSFYLDDGWSPGEQGFCVASFDGTSVGSVQYAPRRDPSKGRNQRQIGKPWLTLTAHGGMLSDRTGNIINMWEWHPTIVGRPTLDEPIEVRCVCVCVCVVVGAASYGGVCVCKC